MRPRRRRRERRRAQTTAKLPRSFVSFCTRRGLFRHHTTTKAFREESFPTSEGDVKFFEIHGDGKVELNSFVPFRYNPTAIAATSPDTPTQMIAVAGRTAVKLYRYETLDFRGGLYGHERTVTDVKFSSTGREQILVATVSNDMMLKVPLCLSLQYVRFLALFSLDCS